MEPNGSVPAPAALVRMARAIGMARARGWQHWQQATDEQRPRPVAAANAHRGGVAGAWLARTHAFHPRPRRCIGEYKLEAAGGCPILLNLRLEVAFLADQS